MPSPDDEEGEQFWKKVINRLKNDQGINAMIIYSIRLWILTLYIKRMYENLTDQKRKKKQEKPTNPNADHVM